MKEATHRRDQGSASDIFGLEALTAVPAQPGAMTGPGGRPWRVVAICPCFNRPQDMELLLTDFARQDTRGIDFWVVIVDNASTQPLSTLRRPPELAVEFVRSEENTGGSGGFNLGMSHVLSGKGLTGRMGEPDFIWWVDSDARVSRRAMRSLVRVLARNTHVGAVGSAMGEIATGHIWEAGGKLYKKRGTFGPAAAGDIDRRALIRCDYVAACSAMVRTSAVRATGLFPENFIYYDDIDWGVQMRRRTGLVCRATRQSRAFHPPGIRRFTTWGRYYIARNGFSVIEMKGWGPLVRYRRAWFELPRAAAQAVMGLDELSELHLKGLQDAADGRFVRIEPRHLCKPMGFRPFVQLPGAVREAAAAFGPSASIYVHPLLKNKLPGFEALRRSLREIKFAWPRGTKRWKRRHLGANPVRDTLAAAARLLLGPTADVAIVPTGWPSCWFRGRVVFQVTSDGFLSRPVRPWRQAWNAAKIISRGTRLALRLAAKSPGIRPLPPAPAWNPEAPATHAGAPPHAERAQPVTAV